MKITYHGHSVVLVELADGQRILFDPFITGNPLTDLDPAEVQADWLVITHGHGDHIGDMVEIAKRNQATVISSPEICSFAEKSGVERTHGMNIGGKFDFPFGRLTMVFAQHSSGLEVAGEMIYMGEPAGFILQAEGKTIYHAGDTAYFTDLALVAEDFQVDLAFLPIGDNFTMGPNAAVNAAKAIRAKKVVPIHFNTFPVIKQDPQKFAAQLPGVAQVMAFGETIEV